MASATGFFINLVIPDNVHLCAVDLITRRWQTRAHAQIKTGFLNEQKPRLVQLVPAAGLEPATS
ncbi:protein of unknown function [Paraburkholderia dioscoreae]|uniref:Uncharacterized protein n=1 Tax=Paraburkholderia dioscoreae TaxID=2604047 RepID=A0A5Q4Z2L0_9BURK|nr:protein of unknown function [Paraburkholderia dioscoreae]